MSDVVGALDQMRLAVGETDAMAAIAVMWFDSADWSGADPVLVERAGYLLDVIARSAATAAAKVDGVHAAVADTQPVPKGEQWDESQGTASAPGEEPAMSDAEIVRRVRAQCPDDRYRGRPDYELVQLFKRNKEVLGTSDDDVIAAMTQPR